MIVIRKKVSLEFLGEDYKDAYLTFKSIPVIEYEEYQKEIKTMEDKKDSSLTFILGILKKQFIEGQFPDNGKLEPVEANDLGGLDPQACLECFKVFTGQKIDPKAVTPSTSSSPTVESLPSSS
jgi:hypothetical protein